MKKKVFSRFCKILTSALLLILSAGVISNTIYAQSQSSSADNNGIRPLNYDVGIHGLTANTHWLSDLHYKGNSKELTYDESSELEFVYRNVRTMFPRLGVGYQVVTSFFTDSENADFGVGSWGVGPIVRAYPFKTDRLQPYVQLNSLFGNNLAMGTLANTDKDMGFRVRLGLRAGMAIRISNNVGIFTEVGYDWESDRLFKSDSRNLQANIGIDYYLFN
ncbi:hypothetical protein CK503_05730 [Aliifodinibius salipaludis]|uniref:Outer membrane protein beta-barrel domain-containing protein n=1 Tax=Fodinibius salipaludis TaxID=2032627 RepID=A0A2A2GDA2_9BACT|nr:hypothetical protein [Aliifodinibius salipaludis]PAU94964.1 hypothetical protein CK503_05730 [Aliifodinibius salipaludis]